MIPGANIPPPPIGWPLFPQPDAHGRLAFPSLGESVRQNLQVILSTRPGEQLMRADYGAGLVDFLGEPSDVSTRQRIYDRVNESVLQWEPRILLDRVDVNDQPDSPGVLRIEIAYRLRRTGESQALGVSLELNS